jgi:hypothetical protein
MKMLHMLRLCFAMLLFATLFALGCSGPTQAKFLTPDTWDPWKEGVDFNRYAYGADDPINKSDPNGHATFTTNKGNVYRVTRDRDRGIYRDNRFTNLNTKRDVLSAIKAGNVSWATMTDKSKMQLMGKSRYIDSFREGNREWVINFGNDKTTEIYQKSRDYLSRFGNKNRASIAVDSRAGGPLDIKTKLGAYNGFVFRGEYLSGRELGNVLFGLNAGGAGLNMTGTMKNAGAYNQQGAYGILKNAIGLGAPNSPPYYGEDDYSGRNIHYGFGLAVPLHYSQTLPPDVP